MKELDYIKKNLALENLHLSERAENLLKQYLQEGRSVEEVLAALRSELDHE